MDSRDIKNLCEAYVAVYDDGLRDEIEYSSMDEDLSFVDDLSDNELIQIMEEIFEETTIDLDECLNSLGFFLSEAVVTRGGQKARERRAATSTARITSSADRRAGKTSERQQKVRIGRLAQAAQTAAEYPGKQARRAATAVAGGARAAAARANTLAGGAASAAAGGAAEAGRKIQSAKEKVKGFLGKVGRAAKAGYRAAKKEFSGQAAREAQGRSDLRSVNRTLRRQARERSGKDTSEFGEEYELDEAMSSYDRNRQRAAQRAAARNEARKSGKTGIVPGVGYVSQRPEKETWTDQGGRERHKTGARMSSLRTQSEEYDFYDLVLSYLLDEGYAETLEDAEVIMVNMSEDWRDEILEDLEQLDEISDRLAKATTRRRKRDVERTLDNYSEPDSHKLATQVSALNRNKELMKRRSQRKGK